MEYLGVKVFIILGLFCSLIAVVYWATNKLKEHWSNNKQ